ncbi:hypothetical protein VaNZ11_007247 [Volvox africanus]|uniref:C2H2-type domain-containing protein n=1 Tax=Volvox africanus TaxID=51714 RepID=A0ABQ5S2F7_9CHLO|nr:hypothetical protein VaNZ11_007247 [Volvox africanus]
MLKRRDWLHLHGKSGGASSSDDETDKSSSESQGEGTEDIDDAADGEAVESDDASGEMGRSTYSSDEGDDEDDGRPCKRLARSFDDISDPDEDEQGDSEDDDVAADGITADHVMKAWSSNDPEVNGFKGIALRCVSCNVMLLNRAVYLSHVASKKHLSRLKLQKPGGAPEAIQLASEVSRHKEEETETHAERLERISRLAMAGPPTAAAKARVKLGSQGVKAAEPTPQQTAAALKGASAGKEAKGQAAKHPHPATRGDDDDSLPNGEDSQADGEDPVLVAGRRTKLKAHVTSTGATKAGGGISGGVGEDSGKRKRKRHGNKMGKRERLALKAAIAAGEVPPGTKPVVERSGKKGKERKRGKGPEQLVQGQQQHQPGPAAEKRPNDAKAVVRNIVAKQQQQQQQKQQDGQTKEKKDKRLKHAGGLPAASAAAVAGTAAAVAVASAGSGPGKASGQTGPGPNHTSWGEGKDAAVATGGKTHKASKGAAARNGKKAALGVMGTGRKG